MVCVVVSRGIRSKLKNHLLELSTNFLCLNERLAGHIFQTQEIRGNKMPEEVAWKNSENLPSKSYKCGHCGNVMATNFGYQAHISRTGEVVGLLYVCHYCTLPTLFHKDLQIPGIPFGADVSDVDDKSVEDLYNEARRCTSSGAFTAAVLCCRKLLMHIAVARGAKPGETFITYVKYFADNNYIPPGAKDWVDHIRTKGNEANHDIVIMKPDDAKDLLEFIQMLLRIIYEFPATVKRKITPPTTTP